jgi:replication factor C subunit 1
MIPEEPMKKIEEEKSGNECEMWTEKYRPRSIRDLIGNSGVIDNLYNWLKDWDDVVIRGNKK